MRNETKRQESDMSYRSRTRQRGATVIQVAVTLVVMIAIVGLAVDAGRAYLVKTKLSAAVDGAAIAAGQAVVHGSNQTEQRASADRAARAVFAANFPNTMLGVDALTLDPPDIQFSSVFATPPRRYTSISVSAKARLPVTFISVLGFHNLDIPTRAEVVRQDVDVAIVVDSSSSMGLQDSSNPGNRYFDTAIKNAAEFTRQFNQTSDRIAFLTFNSSIWGPMPGVAPNYYGRPLPFRVAPGYDSNVYNLILGTDFYTGNTKLCLGINTAQDMIRGITTDPAPLQVMVVSSDGEANSDCGGGGGAVGDALHAAEAARLAGTHIFSIGYSNSLTDPNDSSLKTMKCIANSADAPADCKKPGQTTGRYCYAGNNAAALAACYADIASQILKMTR
jgi:Flp pilus assembly protein TadG